MGIYQTLFVQLTFVRGIFHEYKRWVQTSATALLLSLYASNAFIIYGLDASLLALVVKFIPRKYFAFSPFSLSAMKAARCCEWKKFLFIYVKACGKINFISPFTLGSFKRAGKEEKSSFRVLESGLLFVSDATFFPTSFPFLFDRQAKPF